MEKKDLPTIEKVRQNYHLLFKEGSPNGGLYSLYYNGEQSVIIHDQDDDIVAVLNKNHEFIYLDEKARTGLRRLVTKGMI